MIKKPAADTNWSRLGTMPFSVLLPKLGDVSKLNDYTELLQAQLDWVRSLDEGATVEDVRKRLGEEGMLLQIFQWLNMGEDSAL